MRIERLTLHDVGPFEDLDISFPECPDPTKAEVHMFIGPNGSGKSTLLYALAQMFGGDLLPTRFVLASGGHRKQELV
jgi:predicted ATP-binding protein involved in virulence